MFCVSSRRLYSIYLDLNGVVQVFRPQYAAWLSSSNNVCVQAGIDLLLSDADLVRICFEKWETFISQTILAPTNVPALK
jgi:hypothetical protein